MLHYHIPFFRIQPANVEVTGIYLVHLILVINILNKKQKKEDTY